MSARKAVGPDSPERIRPERVRKPLYNAPTPAAAALHYADDPTPILEAMYRRIWETSMHDMPFVNSALSVAAIGFRRHGGPTWPRATASAFSFRLANSNSSPTTTPAAIFRPTNIARCLRRSVSFLRTRRHWRRQRKRWRPCLRWSRQQWSNLRPKRNRLPPRRQFQRVAPFCAASLAGAAKRRFRLARNSRCRAAACSPACR
jgi:hypothetical protein